MSNDHSDRVDVHPVLHRLFKVASAVTMVGWLLVFLVPEWVVENTIMLAWVLVPLCLLYVFLLVAGRKFEPEGFKPAGNFSSLSGVVRLFRAPSAVFAGWVHYLVFDLVVGIAILHDALRLGIPFLMVVPCLFFTLMLGPFGFLLYFLLSRFYI